LATDDLDGDLADYREAGVRALGPPSVNVFGKQIVFLHPSDMFGALVELEGR
jgi:hypothetical protein